MRARAALPVAWPNSSGGSDDSEREEGEEREGTEQRADLSIDANLNASLTDAQRTSAEQRIAKYWLDGDLSPAALLRPQLEEIQRSGDRFTVANYCAQILLLFSEQPQIIERHNHGLMEHFPDVVDQIGLERWDRIAQDSSLFVRLDRLSSYLKSVCRFSSTPPKPTGNTPSHQP